MAGRTRLWLLLLLVVVLQLGVRRASGSVPSADQEEVCGIDRIGLFWSAVGGRGFLSEERRGAGGDDAGGLAACEALETYSRDVCFVCEPRREELVRIGRAFCGLELQLDALQESKDCFSGAFLFCFSLLCPCFRSRRRDLSEDPVLGSNNSLHSISSSELRSTSGSIPGSPLRIPPSPSRFSLSSQPVAVGHLNLSLPHIIKLTRNFSHSFVIGEGVFGMVYKAVLPNGQVIAIKRAKKEHFATLQTEFSNEVDLLAKIEHRNLVRLLGYIDKDNERIIITEYVPNGTLREHLDGKRGKVLSFSQRLEIAIDIAHGLTYLHLYAEKTIIHRDVKSKNILLTEGLRAKVADFGFARTGPLDGDQTHVETRVKGTVGYIDPEYLKTYKLTPKSDVYSYGILLLEILSARRPIEMHRTAAERITVVWAFNRYNEGNKRVILDPQLREVVNEKVLQNIFALAFQCAAPTRRDRPAMKEVVEKLWEIRKDYAKSHQLV